MPSCFYNTHVIGSNEVSLKEPALTMASETAQHSDCEVHAPFYLRNPDATLS